MNILSGRSIALLIALASGASARGQGEPASRFPTIPAKHEHARKLLDNAMRYVDPANKLVDPVSGYPVEGWNQDPSKGLFLRSFTQLTAIGQYMELLANVAAGKADTPYLSRPQALQELTKLVKTLRADQQDPKLASKGLLGNFLDLATGKRLGPLASDIDKSRIFEVFGAEKGKALWTALQAAGWIAPRNKDQEAEIRRGAKYGFEYFAGPLAPFADPATKTKVMELLDRRIVMAIFGDNANLSASVAKTLGALLGPEIKDQAGVAAIRGNLEAFLEAQSAGYAHLYDPKAGLFDFGWDATKDRLFGWEDPKGDWTIGHMDYLVNEFRGPATFVALRFGLPTDAVANLGFKMKAYRDDKGKDLFALAPWEGSAFQAFGLSMTMGEATRPGWSRLLRNVVEIEVDFASQSRLPGFLSESYTGDGVQYTGSVGIPAITVSPKPRITTAASLYTLGVAYSLEPEKVEAFLASNWPTIEKLMTDHGPWEGFNVAKGEEIRFQTTAHTLALILGMLDQSSENMNRYLESKGASARLATFFEAADRPVDFLAASNNVFAWSPNKGDMLTSGREGSGFKVQGDAIQEFGIAFIPSDPAGVNLSGGVLTVTYRSDKAIEATIQLKPKGRLPGLIPQEISIRFDETKRGTIEIPLPSTPGLYHVGEVVITHGPDSAKPTIELGISGLRFEPAHVKVD